MVDKNIVLKAVANIEENINELKKANDITWEKYQHDNRAKKFVERSLHIIIEACIDIAQHIISDEGFREAETYKETFIVLMENGIIPEPEIKTYEKIAMFRNLLVHYYEKIDDEIVYALFKNKLSDFEKYISYILKYINRPTPPFF